MSFFTVSGTARMIPAEDQKVHIGTKQRVDTAYYLLAFNKKPTVEEINIRSVYSRNSIKTILCIQDRNESVLATIHMNFQIPEYFCNKIMHV